MLNVHDEIVVFDPALPPHLQTPRVARVVGLNPFSVHNAPSHWFQDPGAVEVAVMKAGVPGDIVVLSVLLQ